MLAARLRATLEARRRATPRKRRSWASSSKNTDFFISSSDTSSDADDMTGEEDSEHDLRAQPPKRFRPEEIEISNAIGFGSYAMVYLARRRGETSQVRCALKAVPKYVAASSSADLRHLWSEREVLGLMSSPFVVGLVGTLQDELNVYFVLDFEPGGDLYERMRDAGGRLPPDHAMFYAACALLAIEHVHGSGCVHRDIKPENFVLGSDGYAKLTDFGLSWRLGRGEQLLSMFGTPAYVAPEVLRGKGHAKAVDLWSLGVLIYELLVGHPPWGHGGWVNPTHQDGQALRPEIHLFQEVVSGRVGYPPGRAVDAAAAGVIAGLLRQEPEKRLGMVDGNDNGKAATATTLAVYVRGAQGGCQGSSGEEAVGGSGGSRGCCYAPLRRHAFFAQTDWGALAARRVPAPHVVAALTVEGEGLEGGGGGGGGGVGGGGADSGAFYPLTAGEGCEYDNDFDYDGVFCGF